MNNEQCMNHEQWTNGNIQLFDQFSYYEISTDNIAWTMNSEQNGTILLKRVWNIYINISTYFRHFINLFKFCHFLCSAVHQYIYVYVGPIPSKPTWKTVKIYTLKLMLLQILN